jgi:hypothetical protein
MFFKMVSHPKISEFLQKMTKIDSTKEREIDRERDIGGEGENIQKYLKNFACQKIKDRFVFSEIY